MNAAKPEYHPPQRKPAHETLEKILVAGEEQLREEELDAFTVQSVLRRAGLSVGAFYSRFPDKTALLHDLQARVHNRVDAKTFAELEAHTGKTESLEEAMDIGLGTLVRNLLSERALFRAFMMLSVFDPVMRERGEQHARERRRALADFLAPHRDEIAHPDPDLAIDSACAIYSSTMRGQLIYYNSPGNAQPSVSDEMLFNDLKRSLAAFLRGPAHDTSTSSSSTQTGTRGR